MSKLRMMVGLVGMLCALGVAASPALALFEGTAGNSGLGSGTNPILAIPGGESVCSKADGSYTVWNAATTKNGTEIVQTATKRGPHGLISVTKWNGCAITVGGKVLAATVTPCKFNLKQPTAGSTTATADVASECVITSGACLIKVPQVAANESLSTVTLANSGANLNATANVGGITANVNAGCKAIGLESTTTGTFKSVVTGTNLQEV